jgi:hypothetical protein
VIRAKSLPKAAEVQLGQLQKSKSPEAAASGLLRMSAQIAINQLIAPE